MQHNYLHYNTVLCCNNKYYLQWGTNTTKIQIRISLTVHWSIYNTFFYILLAWLYLYMWIKKRFLLCRNVRGKGESFLFWEKDCAFYISK